jgi:hypothetical protein
MGLSNLGSRQDTHQHGPQTGFPFAVSEVRSPLIFSLPFYCLLHLLVVGF